MNLLKILSLSTLMLLTAPFTFASSENSQATYLKNPMQAFWKFHEATKEEKQQFASAIPSFPDYEPLKEVEQVSQAVELPMYPGKLLAQVLYYYAESTEDNDYDKNVYQVVVTDESGKILNKHIIMDSPYFMIGHDGSTGPYIYSLRGNKDGDLGYEKQSLLPKGSTPWFEKIYGWKAADVKDFLPSFRPYHETLLLGQPENGRYGLYLAHGTTNRPKLILPLEDVVPGFELNPLHSKPILVSRSLLSVYQNARGVFALVNNLNGIVSVNIDTGETKTIYQVPDRGRFAYVLKTEKNVEERNCTSLVVGVYDETQGNSFYSNVSHMEDYVWYPGSVETKPAYTLHLGVFFDEQFFRVAPNGCYKLKE